jgi:hypothetical protein
MYCSREGICHGHGDNWHRYWPIIYITESYIHFFDVIDLGFPARISVGRVPYGPVNSLLYVSSDRWDRSRQTAPSPPLCYSLTHAHRSIGYRNLNPQSLSESVVRPMYLRVLQCQSTYLLPARTLPVRILLTHTYTQHPPRATTPTLLTITHTQVLWFLPCLVRPTTSS